MSPAAPLESLQVTRFTGGPFAENTYLVRDPSAGRAAAVDPGAAVPDLLEELRRSGDTLEAIYLTHPHFDHVEGVPALLEYASAPVFLHPAARPLYEWADRGAAMFGAKLPAPLPPPDRDFVPGEAVRVGGHELEVRHTPGHAPGHVVLYSPEAGFALVGDVVFRGSIGRSDLPGGDFRQLIESIRREVLTLPDETRLLPGHGPETTVAAERLGNPFLISQAAGELA